MSQICLPRFFLLSLGEPGFLSYVAVPLSNSVFIVFCGLVAGVFVGLSFFAGIQDIFNMVLTPRFIEMLVLVAPPD